MLPLVLKLWCVHHSGQRAERGWGQQTGWVPDPAKAVSCRLSWRQEFGRWPNFTLLCDHSAGSGSSLGMFFSHNLSIRDVILYFSYVYLIVSLTVIHWGRTQKVSVGQLKTRYCSSLKNMKKRVGRNRNLLHLETNSMELEFEQMNYVFMFLSSVYP